LLWTFKKVVEFVAAESGSSLAVTARLPGKHEEIIAYLSCHHLPDCFFQPTS